MAKRVALIGHPVTHSLSGVLQQAAFDSLGIDARYELVDRLLIDLPETIATLRDARPSAPTSRCPSRNARCR